jgi:hypothetical protein
MNSTDNSFNVLSSIINSIGGLDQFYSVSIRKNDITLQAKYAPHIVKNVHGCFENEIGSVDAPTKSWDIDTNGYLSMTILYNGVTFKVNLTD